MNDQQEVNARDPGPYQHAHAAPTTRQLRTVGQRRLEAEEKLEHHLDGARHRTELHETTEQPPEATAASRDVPPVLTTPPEDQPAD